MFAVEMKEITKKFGNLTANDSVNLTVRMGEIHSLVGENGAGKSTLMNILYGYYRPDSGDIFVNGKRRSMQRPSDAIRIGIGMMHQHFMLIPPLTVAENIILGSEPTSSFNRLDLRSAVSTIKKLSETYSLGIDPEAKIENLSVGLQQRVEILKILYRNADLLILDEPTPVLTPQEVENLFRTLKELKSSGKTVVIITHKLNEVMAISDSVTVLRRGKDVGRLETKSTGVKELARLMVGSLIEQRVRKKEIQPAGPLLVVKNISAIDERSLPVLKNISFEISKGEVLGIAGVHGNGQTELAEVVAGMRKITSGEMYLNGISLKYPSSKKSVSHIPEDRLKRGIILDFPLAENLILGRQRENIFYRYAFKMGSNINEYVLKLIDEYDIRPPDKHQTARGFSGGNQQKAVVARELSKNCPLIIANQPTRGLDIGATNFVHDLLLSERNKGKGLLLITSDLEELFKLSDRIAVIYEGEIAGLLTAGETSERELGEFMAGAKRKSA